MRAVIDPEGLAAQRFPVRVETGHGFGRGQTVVDRRIWTTGVEHGPHGRARTEVDVALGVDAARYTDLWVRTVCGG